MSLKKLQELFQKRRWRIRKKIQGIAERPRLVVTFTNSHIYAQCIDDTAGNTRVAVSTLSKEIRTKKLRTNIAGATEMGRIMGEKTKKAGITRVVFDRAGRRYHGCIKAFADAARQAGLEF